MYGEANEGGKPMFAVGLEGGVSRVAEESTDGEGGGAKYPLLECFAWMAVQNCSSGAVYCSRTASFTLPPAVTDLMQREGMELGDADDQVFGRTNSKQKDGTVGILTNGIIDREEYYRHALIFALVPCMEPNKDLYVREQAQASSAGGGGDGGSS